MAMGGAIGGGLFGTLVKKGLLTEDAVLTEQALKSFVGSPFSFATSSVADDLASGRPIDWENAGVSAATAIPFELPHVYGSFGAQRALNDSKYQINKSARSAIARRDVNSLINFMDASPEDIMKAMNRTETAAELQANALMKGDEAIKAKTYKDKNALHLQQISMQRDADIKRIGEKIIAEGPQGIIDATEGSGLSESMKNDFADNANILHRTFNPVEIQKTDLGNSIEGLNNNIDQLNQTIANVPDQEGRAPHYLTLNDLVGQKVKAQTQLFELNQKQHYDDQYRKMLQQSLDKLESDHDQAHKEIQESDLEGVPEDRKFSSPLNPEFHAATREELERKIYSHYADEHNKLINPETTNGAEPVSIDPEVQATVNDLEKRREEAHAGIGEVENADQLHKDIDEQFNHRISEVRKDGEVNGDPKETVKYFTEKGTPSEEEPEIKPYAISNDKIGDAHIVDYNTSDGTVTLKTEDGHLEKVPKEEHALLGINDHDIHQFKVSNGISDNTAETVHDKVNRLAGKLAAKEEDFTHEEMKFYENHEAEVKAALDQATHFTPPVPEEVQKSKTTSKIHDRPDMERPVHKVTIDGKDYFIQRMDGMNSGSSWYQVEKKGKSWALVDDSRHDASWVGDNKSEAIKRLEGRHSEQPSEERLFRSMGGPIDGSGKGQNTFRDGKEPGVHSSMVGVDAVIETLKQGIADGHIERRAANLAARLMSRNPELFKDFALQIAGVSKDSPGEQGYYSAKSNMATIFGTAKNTLTVATHEFLHHTERYLPHDVRDGITVEWYANLKREKGLVEKQLGKEKDPEKRKQLEMAHEYLSLAETIQDADGTNERNATYEKLDSYFDDKNNLDGKYYRFHNASEWWTVNASEMFAKKHLPEAKTWVEKAKVWYKDFIKEAKAVFGVNRTFHVEKGLNDILNGRALPEMEGGMLGDRILSHAKGRKAKAEAEGKAENKAEGEKPEESKAEPEAEVKPEAVEKTEAGPPTRELTFDEQLMRDPNSSRRLQKLPGEGQRDFINRLREVRLKEDAMREEYEKQQKEARDSGKTPPPPPEPPAKKSQAAKEHSAPVWDVKPETIAEMAQRKGQNSTNRFEKVQKTIEEAGGHINDRTNFTESLALQGAKISDHMRRVWEKFVKSKEKDNPSFFQRLVKDGHVKSDLDKFLFASHVEEYNKEIGHRRRTAYESELERLRKGRKEAEKNGSANTVRDYDQKIADLIDQKNERYPLMDDGASGMTTAEAKGILEKFKADGKYDALKKYSDEFNKFVSKEDLAVRLKTGLIDQDTHDVLNKRYENYVPFQVEQFLEPKEGQPVRRKSPVIVTKVDNLIRRARGSVDHKMEDRVSPSAYGIHQLQMSHMEGEKNLTLNKLYNLVEQHPNPDYWEIVNPRYKPEKRSDGSFSHFQEITPVDVVNNSLQLYRDGRKVYIHLKDPLLRRAMDPKSLSKAWPVFSHINNYLRKVNTTLNPEWWMANGIKDIQTAGITLSAKEQKGLAKSMIKNVIPAAAAVFQYENGKRGTEWTDLVDRAHKAGVQMTVARSEMDLEKLKRIDRVVEEMGQKKNLIKNVKDLSSYIAAAGDASEMGTRIAAFKAGIDAGMTDEQAAVLARNATVDFSKKGEWSGFLGSMYLMFNGGIQGKYNFVKLGIKSRTAQKVYSGVFILGYMSAAHNRAMSTPGNPKDDYDLVPEFDKANNFIFKASHKDGFIKIPSGHGLNMLYYLGQKTYDVVHGYAHPDKAAMDMLGSIGNSVVPNWNATLLQSVTPTAPLQMLVQYKENTNAFGSPIHKEQNSSIKQPESESGFQHTDQNYVDVAKWLNHHTGGTGVKSGIMDFNPNTMDWIIGNATGGVGRTAGQTAETAAALTKQLMKKVDIIDSKTQLDPMEIRSIPFLRKFYTEGNPNGIKATIFETLQKSGNHELSASEISEFNQAVTRSAVSGQITPQQAKQYFQELTKNRVRIMIGNVAPDLNKKTIDQAMKKK
jgi:hypothetical protein